MNKFKCKVCKKNNIPCPKPDIESKKRKQLELKKVYYEKNKQLIREKQRKYYYDKLEYNRNRGKGKRVYCSLKNKEKFQNRYKNLKFNIMHRLRARMNVFIKHKGLSKKSKTNQMLGIDYERLMRYLKNTFEYNYGIPFNFINIKNLHIDHVTPLSCASSDNEEEISKLFHYTNLQFLFKTDNLKKNNKLDYSID